VDDCVEMTLNYLFDIALLLRLVSLWRGMLHWCRFEEKRGNAMPVVFPAWGLVLVLALTQFFNP